MKKQTLILILIITALACLGYAIYRSTEEKIIVTQNTMQTVYGETQHGLILGLCLLAGICILSIIPLMLDRQQIDSKEEEPATVKKKLL